MSAVLDLEHPDANMFGCLPCPKCGSKYRAPFASKADPKVVNVECDDCGLKEGPATNADGRE